jgi:hypothetical protein
LFAREYACPRLRLCLIEGSLPDPGPRVVHLLAPGREDRLCAWLEL